jgi:hypothetical protein
MSLFVIFVTATLLVSLGSGGLSDARAELVFTDPGLPPESDPPDCDDLISLYAADGLWATYPGPINMSYPRHKCFTNVVRTDIGPDERQDFDSIMELKVDMGLGPKPVTLTGPVTTIAYSKAGNTTGLFDTEMVSLSLVGMAEGSTIEIRESPDLASLGQADIADLGGGLYQIDSFFDVFTELSVDSGPWMPQVNQPVRLTLVPIETVPVETATWGAIKALFH